MAVIEGGVSGQLADVGMGASVLWLPQHVAAGPLPVGTGGGYRLSATSGTMAASLAANSEIFQLRYVTAASRKALIHGISVSAAVLTLPAVSTTVAVGPFTFRAAIARAWTADGSGGTALGLTGNNQKLRTTHATSEVSTSRIASTGALTAGTKTIDGNDIGSVTSSLVFATAAGAASGVLVPKTNLMGDFAGSLAFPVVLDHQEGIIVRIGAAFPGTMTWAFTIDVAWSEVQSF